MSIASPLQLDLANPSYTDMAAGSELESVEASSVAVEKSSYLHDICSSSSQHFYSYIGLPYADHNYGARPPPTPPASPHPAELLHPLDSLFVSASQDGILSGTAISTSEDSSYGGDITRCICGFTHDDGYMICCDKCSVWQHIDCMGIDRLCIPETYLCERCHPRSLDRDKAVALQMRKRENLIDGDTSATESGDEVPLELYTSFHTPTSITSGIARIANKPADKRRKRSTDKEPVPKKAFREGSRKSSRVKGLPPGVASVNPPLLWENRIKMWMEHYEEASSNQYSEEVQALLSVKKDSDRKLATYCTHGAAFIPPVECHVQKNKKILKATCDLAPDSLIIEYRGKFMLRQHFEANGWFFKRPYPFVLFYSKFDGLEMCVDARSFGTEARFIRRSCTPNAEVRHVMEEGLLHLYIYSVRHIAMGSEITIGFDYDYGDCKYKIDCACLMSNLDCPVQRHNGESLENLGSSHESRRRRGGHKEFVCERQCDGMQNQNISMDGDGVGRKGKVLVANKQRKMSPLRLSISNNQEPRVTDDVEEKHTVGNETEMYSEELITERKRKMTREERKMEAILQAFARMEKREKRREQALERVGTKTEVGVCQDMKEELLTTTDNETPCVLQQQPDVVKVEAKTKAAPAAAKISRSKHRKSFPRTRVHVGQQRRRARTISTCSDLQPCSPVDCSDIMPAQPPETQMPTSVLETETLDHAPSASPEHSQTATCHSSAKQPKTKKNIVTEWMGEKPDRAPSTPNPSLAERPLRISTDPEVLATQLNSLPGLTHSPHLYTTPKHYVRFSSPFLAQRSPTTPSVPTGRRRSREQPQTSPTSGSCKKRWLKQALEDQGSPCPVGHPPFILQNEGSQSPYINGHLESPPLLISFCPSPEMPAPLKKRRFCTLDSCVSDSSTPYASPCGTPTRSDLQDMPGTLLFPATPPCCVPHDTDAETGTPQSVSESPQAPPFQPVLETELFHPDCSKSSIEDTEQPPLLLSCLSVTIPGLEIPPHRISIVSPQPHQSEQKNKEEEGPVVTGNAEVDVTVSYITVLQSPEKAGLSFSPTNCNLRDLTPSHLLEPETFQPESAEEAFSEGALCNTCPEEVSYLGCVHSAGLELDSVTDTTLHPPQKKKVSLLEYRKRQHVARSSGPKAECGSPGPWGYRAEDKPVSEGADSYGQIGNEEDQCTLVTLLQLERAKSFHKAKQLKDHGNKTAKHSEAGADVRLKDADEAYLASTTTTPVLNKPSLPSVSNQSHTHSPCRINQTPVTFDQGSHHQIPSVLPSPQAHSQGSQYCNQRTLQSQPCPASPTVYSNQSSSPPPPPPPHLHYKMLPLNQTHTSLDYQSPSPPPPPPPTESSVPVTLHQTPLSTPSDIIHLSLMTSSAPILPTHLHIASGTLGAPASAASYSTKHTGVSWH